MTRTPLSVPQILLKALRERGMTPSELGRPLKTVNDIIEGKTVTLAIQLRISTSFWTASR